MAALISFLLSLLKRPPVINWRHDSGLPPPPVLHKVLHKEFVDQFKEVFVIGDVHGCYDELVELLDKASVRSSTGVLKLFVGDLVNKGPKSREVLQLVRNMDNAFSVRGNHDEVVLLVHARHKQDPHVPLGPHNLWIKDLPQEDLDYLHRLPYTISLPSLNAIIVHAGLIPGRPLERMAPKHLITMRNLKFGDYFWNEGISATSSDKQGEPWANLWPGPEHVYFGHDAKRMLQMYPHATGLDTGCVYGKRLTGIFIHGPRKGEIIDVPAKHAYKPVSS